MLALNRSRKKKNTNQGTITGQLGKTHIKKVFFLVVGPLKGVGRVNPSDH